MEQIKLNRKSISKLLGKLIYLEERLGKNANFKILNPAEIPNKGTDIPAIYEYVAYIKNFIGLSNVSFIITKANFSENKAATTKQTSSMNAEITLNDKMCKNTEVVLAILSHEITHHYLFYHQVYDINEFENEILTDVATIYLGLGKLVLNGCYNTDVNFTRLPDGIINESTTTRTGYIDNDSFNFVYEIICSARSINYKNRIANLNNSAFEASDNLDKKRGAFIYTQHKEEWRECIDGKSNFEYSYFKTPLFENTKFLLNNINTYAKAVNNNLAPIRNQYNKTIKHINAEQAKQSFNPVMNYLRKKKLTLDANDVFLEIQNKLDNDNLLSEIIKRNKFIKSKTNVKRKNENNLFDQNFSKSAIIYIIFSLFLVIVLIVIALRFS